MTRADAGGGAVRVAILGGGPAGLAAAWKLAQQGGYDITVYTMGWRLGGKCASGRRMADGRGLEHGLHVLGGFYHQSLGMLRQVYDEWARVGAHPFPFDDAFLPHNLVHLLEDGPDGKIAVKIPFFPRPAPFGCDKVPDPDPIATPHRFLSWIKVKTAAGAPRGAPYADRPEFQAALDQAIAATDPKVLEQEMRLQVNPPPGFAPPPPLWSVALPKVLEFTAAPSFAAPPPTVEQDPDFGVIFNLAAATVAGILADGLWRDDDFDKINGHDMIDWLISHGARTSDTNSTYVRCGYDYAFAYLDGDPDRPSMSAGAALRGLRALLFTSNKAVFAHMWGTMGEVVFTPLYEVLKSHGVKFRFFHRVDQLVLDDAGARLASVSGHVQNLPQAEEYDPLLPYQPGKGEVRMTWPDQPIDARLQFHPALPSRPEFLYETAYTLPPDAKPFKLLQDEDFDLCVLAIPVGALGGMCGDLAAKSPDWATMLGAAQTAPTLSAQLWQNQDTKTLGWSYGATILTHEAMPLSTWADMSFLDPLEKDPAASLQFFCGPFRRVYYDAAAIGGGGVPDRELERGVEGAHDWFHSYLVDLLPNASVVRAGEALPAGSELYVRTNSEPAEAYVLSPPGTIDKRLAPGGSFVTNLFLAGDWTKNGMDIGSFETAVWSGIKCAQAIIAGPAGGAP